jgi:putative ABC transport system substrate-binding protein
LAANLVQLKVDVIVAAGPPAISAAQKVTTTVPIVMANSGDPVGSGFVKSLAHPGGNITGRSNLSGDVGPKQLEMLLSMVPKLSRVAVLMNPTNSGNSAMLKVVEIAAQKVRVKVLPMEVRTTQEIETAFSEMARRKAGAVIVARDPFLNRQLREIAELAAKNRLPTISGIREFVEAGGLMSYGASLTDMWRRVATHVDKICKGAEPADLPVEQPTTFELLINGKTAKTLGLKIPNSLLIGADKVIE